MRSWNWIPVPTLTCEQRVEAAEVMLVYLASNLFAFHLTLCMENEALLFWDTWGGKILHPEVMQFENIEMFHIFFICFSRMANALLGHVSACTACWMGTNSTAQGGSGSILSWLNMDVWWWLKTICFCQSTKLQTSLSVIDELVGVNWIKGGTLINEMLWHWNIWWLPAMECFSVIGQIKFKKNLFSLFFFPVCVFLLCSHRRNFPFFIFKVCVSTLLLLLVFFSLSHTLT